MKNISNWYRTKGVDEFYKIYGNDYVNPHEKHIRSLLTDELTQTRYKSALDLACGSGEVTLILKEYGVENIEGIDPYTTKLYLNRTTKTARKFTFQDIANGKLINEYYDVVICSFAMHLIDKSWLPALCYNIKQITNVLIILTPHKNPYIDESWGWKLQKEVYKNKVRFRKYISN